MDLAKSDSIQPYEPPTRIYDVILNPSTSTGPLNPALESQFKRMAHFSFLLHEERFREQLYWHATDYLHVSGTYWTSMALALIGGLHHTNQDLVFGFLDRCYDSTTGAWSGNVNHNIHILYTLSALQLHALFGKMDHPNINKRKIIDYIASLQRPDGSFAGDCWGEVDTRFSYPAILCLAILGVLPSRKQIRQLFLAKNQSSTVHDDQPIVSSSGTTSVHDQAINEWLKQELEGQQDPLPFGFVQSQVSSSSSTSSQPKEVKNSPETTPSLPEAEEPEDLVQYTLSKIDFYQATLYVLSCRNFDGAFGAVTGAESHSGQIFCCIAFLCLLHVIPSRFHQNSYHPIINNGSVIENPDSRADSTTQTQEEPLVTTTTTTTVSPPTTLSSSQRAALVSQADPQSDVLCWWLCERQLPNGGLNGRPEKKEDVCYSWWVLTGLTALERIDWINPRQLTSFILSCQDDVFGGISDRSNTMTDIYHTYFGIAGLSLLGNPGFEQIDPIYALPVKVVQEVILARKTDDDDDDDDYAQ